ncbi:DUF6708 domain-containing protein [Achromobacter sp.]|uniref:DUF6708 domain-containing protein n=1 Tax=Achromobacter sp. TaxID=134375 RepID=UPI00289822E6|nr:DUF6708 domain-containing protein [Achromobacter sp.]
MLGLKHKIYDTPLYAYNFKYRWWHPFERWHVHPVTYDWSQVRAESWHKRAVTPLHLICMPPAET